MRIDIDYSRYCILSVVVGLLGLLFWIVPYISVLLAILAIYSGKKGLESELEKLSKIGITMGIMALILSVCMIIVILK